MSLLARTSLVSGATLVSRVAGFVRDAATAAVLGVGPVADALAAALSFSLLARRLLAEGTFNLAFIPALARAPAGAGGRLSAATLIALGAGLAGVALAGIVFMPQLIGIIAPGFADDGTRARDAILCGRIVMLYLPLAGLAAVYGALANAAHRVLLPALAPLAANGVVLGAIVGFVLAGGMEPATAALVIAVASVAAGIAQAAVMWIAARGVPNLPETGATPGRTWPWAAVRGVLRAALPAFLFAGLGQFRLMIVAALVSGVPGAVAALNYAQRLLDLPLGLVGASAGAVLVPALVMARAKSRAANRQEGKGGEEGGEEGAGEEGLDQKTKGLQSKRQEDVGQEDVGHEDLGRGDLHQEDLRRGNLGRGNAGQGEPWPADAGQGGDGQPPTGQCAEDQGGAGQKALGQKAAGPGRQEVASRAAAGQGANHQGAVGHETPVPIRPDTAPPDTARRDAARPAMANPAAARAERVRDDAGRPVAAGIAGAGLAALAFALPAGVGLAVLAEPVVAVLFQRGSFGAADTRFTAGFLAVLALALPAQGLEKILAAAALTSGAVRPAERIALVSLAGCAAAAALLAFGAGPEAATAAVALSAVGSVLALAVLVREGESVAGARQLAGGLLGLLAASAVMGAAVAGLAAAWPAPAGPIGGALRLAALIGAGVGVYGACLLPLRRLLRAAMGHGG